MGMNLHKTIERNRNFGSDDVASVATPLGVAQDCCAHLKVMGRRQT